MQIKKLVQKNKKIIKFTISGSVVALVEFGLLYFLTEKAGLWYLLSAGIGFTVAFFVSFVMQKFWTFKDYCREKIYKQLSMYLAVGLFNLCLNQSLLFVLVEFFHAHYFIAQMFIAGVLGLGSFVMYKLFIFRKYDDTCNGKHILIASGIFPPDLGGPATFAASLARALVNDGHKVRVVSFGERSGGSEPYKISKVNRRQNKLLRYINYFMRLWHYANQADVIYAMDSTSVGLPSAIVKFLDRRVKFIVRLGGDAQWERTVQSGLCGCSMNDYYEKKDFSLKEKISYAINNFVLSVADKVIFNSYLIQDVYVKHRGLDKGKTVVIKNIKPSDEVMKLPTVTDRDKKIVLYAGRLVAFKNLARLIEAFSMFDDEERKTYRLEIFGEGPEEEKLRKMISELGLSDIISLSPKLSRTDLLDKVNNVDLVAMPSLTEVNSNFIAETMFLGKAIAMTKESEHFYVGNIGDGIYYFDPLDTADMLRAIREGLADEKRTFDFSKISEAWEIEKVIESHLKIFSNKI